MDKRHLSPRRGTTVVAVLAAVTLASGCASSDAGSANDAASPSSTPSSTPTSSETETETETAEATPIDGIWTTPTLGRRSTSGSALDRARSRRTMPTRSSPELRQAST